MRRRSWQKLRLLKSGLMTDLLTGRVRVPEAREESAGTHLTDNLTHA